MTLDEYSPNIVMSVRTFLNDEGHQSFIIDCCYTEGTTIIKKCWESQSLTSTMINDARQMLVTLIEKMQ